MWGGSLQESRATTQVMRGLSLRARWDATIVMLTKNEDIIDEQATCVVALDSMHGSRFFCAGFPRGIF